MRKRIVITGRNEYDGSPSYHCFDFDVKFNRHGNIEVSVDKTSSSFVSFFRGPVRYVFCSRSGVCISHTPSKRYRYHSMNAKLVESHT
jgi:hypothetical protein